MFRPKKSRSKIWNQNNLRSKQFWAQKNVAQKDLGGWVGVLDEIKAILNSS